MIFVRNVPSAKMYAVVMQRAGKRCEVETGSTRCTFAAAYVMQTMAGSALDSKRWLALCADHGKQLIRQSKATTGAQCT